MLRINKQGFTLIELMVVIVIIGVLASLAIPRFTEASAKAKMGEAPRIIASFESGYLAGVAEYGDIDSIQQLVVKIDTSSTASKWFKYEPDISKGKAKLSAEAIADIGKFKATEKLETTYDNTTDPDDAKFCRSTTNTSGAVEKLVPSFAGTMQTSCQ